MSRHWYEWFCSVLCVLCHGWRVILASVFIVRESFYLYEIKLKDWHSFRLQAAAAAAAVAPTVPLSPWSKGDRAQVHGQHLLWVIIKCFFGPAEVCPRTPEPPHLHPQLSNPTPSTAESCNQLNEPQRGTVIVSSAFLRGSNSFDAPTPYDSIIPKKNKKIRGLLLFYFLQMATFKFGI